MLVAFTFVENANLTADTKAHVKMQLQRGSNCSQSYYSYDDIPSLPVTTVPYGIAISNTDLAGDDAFKGKLHITRQ